MNKAILRDARVAVRYAGQMMGLLGCLTAKPWGGYGEEFKSYMKKKILGEELKSSHQFVLQAEFQRYISPNAVN
jgi:hypothetical protein